MILIFSALKRPKANAMKSAPVYARKLKSKEKIMEMSVMMANINGTLMERVLDVILRAKIHVHLVPTNAIALSRVKLKVCSFLKCYQIISLTD